MKVRRVALLLLQPRRYIYGRDPAGAGAYNGYIPMLVVAAEIREQSRTRYFSTPFRICQPLTLSHKLSMRVTRQWGGPDGAEFSES